jgi:hypothetical protein
MIRTLNVVAVLALISSATMAYQVKYETILVNEKLRKAESALQKEKDAIAILKAEWELLNRPARLAMLAQPEAGMQTLTVRQIARAADVPKPPAKETDSIADALTGLTTGTIPTGDAARKITPRPAASAAATPRPAVSRANPATPRPDLSRPAGAAAKPSSLQPLPRVSAAAPLALRPPAALGSTRATEPKRNAPQPLRPPQPVGPASVR